MTGLTHVLKYNHVAFIIKVVASENEQHASKNK